MKQWYQVMAAQAIKEKKSDLIDLIRSLTKDGVDRSMIVGILSEEFYDIYEAASDLLSESLSDQLEELLDETSPEPEKEKEIIHLVLEESPHEEAHCVFASSDLLFAEDEMHTLQKKHPSFQYKLESKEVN